MNVLPYAIAMSLTASVSARQAQSSDSEEAPHATVLAYMEAAPLAVGAESTFRVELHFAQGLSASDAGLPAAILQLDVPSSVELVGARVESDRQHARNDFLLEPWERLLTEDVTQVRFRLLSEAGEDATLGINVVGYLRDGDAPARLLRRRLELPLRSGAEAREVAPTRSSWGPDERLLHIGDRAPELRLPRADGSELALDTLLGEGWVVLTTYRAHW